MATHENMICSQILTSDDLKKLEIAKDNIETIITQILDDKILNITMSFLKSLLKLNIFK